MFVAQPDFDENVMRSNLYLLGASGAAIQLTNGPWHDEHPRWSPDSKWIAFISDRDAKPAKAGKRQVWVISPDGGEAWQLTRGTQTIVADRRLGHGHERPSLGTVTRPQAEASLNQKYSEGVFLRIGAWNFASQSRCVRAASAE